MNSKVWAIILLVICLALGVVLLVVRNDATKEKETDTRRILEFSNTVVKTESLLSEQKSVNASLETNLTAKLDENKTLSTELVSTKGTLDQTKAALEKTQAEVKAAAEAAAKAATAAAEAAEEAARNFKVAQDKARDTESKLKEEVALRDARINSLNLNAEELNKKIGSLNTAISGLNTQIAKTEKELSETKGDKEFLLGELKRMQLDKAEMERQMNDLAFLREQVKHLKSEMAISRRLDWMRRGVADDQDKKGGQLMQDGFRASAVKTNVPGAQLNVELKRDGTVTITPITNAPPKAPTKAPAKK